MYKYINKKTYYDLTISYEYDSYGALLKKEVSTIKHNPDNERKNVISNYTYNKSGMLEKIYENYDNLPEPNIISIFYTNNGNIEKKTSSLFDIIKNNAGNKTKDMYFRKIEPYLEYAPNECYYVYDNENNLIEKKEITNRMIYPVHDIGWHKYYYYCLPDFLITQYKYYTSGYLISIYEKEVKPNISALPMYMDTITNISKYDYNGNLTFKKEGYNQGHEFINEYDQKGKILNILDRNISYDIIPSAIYRYYYDSKDLLISRKFFSIDENGKEKFYEGLEFEYIY